MSHVVAIQEILLSMTSNCLNMLHQESIPGSVCPPIGTVH